MPCHFIKASYATGMIHLKYSTHTLTNKLDNMIILRFLHGGTPHFSKTCFLSIGSHVTLRNNQHSLHTNWNSFYCLSLYLYSIAICVLTTYTDQCQLVYFSRVFSADYVSPQLAKCCQWRALNQCWGTDIVVIVSIVMSVQVLHWNAGPLCVLVDVMTTQNFAIRVILLHFFC